MKHTGFLIATISQAAPFFQESVVMTPMTPINGQGERVFQEVPIYEYEFDEQYEESDERTENERGVAGQPEAKLNKMLANARQWVDQNAQDYKKNDKLYKVILKIETKFNNAFNAKNCHLPDLEARIAADTFEYDDVFTPYARKIDVDPMVKAAKFKKGLDRWRNNFIDASCEKAVRLPTLTQKLYQLFESVIISQNGSKADYKLHKRQRKLNLLDHSTDY